MSSLAGPDSGIREMLIVRRTSARTMPPMASASQYVGLILLVVGGASTSRPAAASDAAMRIAYEADAACPSADEFMRQLRGRTRSPVDWARKESADIKVVLKRAARSTTGTVEMNAADGQTVTRSLEADSCEEVVAAAALIAALATGVSADEPRVPAGPSSSPTPETREPDASDRTTGAPRPSPRWHWGGGAAGTLSGGIAPSLAFGGVAFVQAEQPEFPTGRFVVRASFAYAAAPSADRDWGSASFNLMAARLDACPLFLPIASRAGVAACVGATVGAITARGNVARPGGSSGGRPLLWLDITPSLRALLPAGERLWFEANVGLAVPLRRYEFVLEQLGSPANTAQVYPTPAVAAALGAGMGVTF